MRNSFLLFISESIAVCVVAAGDVVHSLDDLVGVDVRTNNDQAAENIPEPESGSAEIGLHAAGTSLIADTLGNLMEPDEGENTTGNFLEEEEDQAIVHCLLTVASGSCHVDVFTDTGPHNDIVDTAGQDTENDELPESSLVVHNHIILRGGCICQEN